MNKKMLLNFPRRANLAARKSFFIALFFLFSAPAVFAGEVIDAASGPSHSLLLFDDGRILPYGMNWCGQLGLPKTVGCQLIAEVPPLYVESSVKFISVAAGDETSLAIAADGTLWGWGRKRYRIGIGEWGDSIETPQLLDDSKDWKKVFAGGNETLALKEDGSLWNLSFLGLEQIQNPNGTAWKDAHIFGGPWGGWDDYTLLVILQDEEDKFWTYGTCRGYQGEIDILHAFLEEKDKDERFDAFHDDFRELLPLKLPAGTTYFNVTRETGLRVDGNNAVIFGLSAADCKRMARILRRNLKMKKKTYPARLANAVAKEEAKELKKAVTGNFTGILTFLFDSYAREAGKHYYSYAALLQNDGSLTVYTNGKKLQGDRPLKVKNIWGGYCLFVQDLDNHVYVVGYEQCGDMHYEENFFCFEPLVFE